MRTVSDYEQRAEKCIARAEIVTHPMDRARWLQLAEQWALLSRLQFQTLESARNEPAGLWRGDVMGE
jgi:hypothetical protein